MKPENNTQKATQTTRRSLLKRAGALTTLGLGATSTVAGQETATDAPPETTATGNESDDEPDGPETVRAQINDGVTLVSYEVLESSSDRVEWKIVVESAYPTQLVLSDVFGGVSGSGVTRVEQDRRTITSGMTTARMTTTTYEGASALGVAVPGGAVTIPYNVDEEDAETVTVPFGISLGAGILFTGTVWAAKKKRDGYRDEPEDVEPKDGGLL